MCFISTVGLCSVLTECKYCSVQVLLFQTMDPAEVVQVRFNYGGQFIHIGPSLDYVGGDTAMSVIERDKLSLQEVKGFLKDHMQLKESMKFYFQIPGKSMVEGLMFLNDDSKCVHMGEYTDVGGVADIYVEYHGEEDSEHSSSGSDFEKDEIMELSDDDFAPDIVISADTVEGTENVVIVPDVIIPDDSGVITQVIISPMKQVHGRRREVAAENVQDDVVASQFPISQVFNPSEAPETTTSDSDSESDSDPEYEPHSEDSGENSEVFIIQCTVANLKVHQLL